ncbi:hypothetical protein MMC27_001466 [Xylographa pallens]|nr:hypothetical protein [Xylographa pallens]
MNSSSFEDVSEHAPSGQSAIEVLTKFSGRERYNLTTLANIRNARSHSVRLFCKGFKDIHHLDAQKIGLGIDHRGPGSPGTVDPAYLDRLKRQSGQEMRMALDKVHHWRTAEKKMTSHIRDERMKNRARKVSRKIFEVGQAQMTIENARKLVEQTHRAIEQTPQAIAQNQSIFDSSSYDLPEKQGLSRGKVWQAIDLESPLFTADEKSPPEKHQDTPCPYRRVSTKKKASNALPRISQRRRLYSAVEEETDDGYSGDAETEGES